MTLNLRELFSTNKLIANKFAQLPTENFIQAEYIWIDLLGETVRSKTRTLDFKPKHVNGKFFIL